VKVKKKGGYCLPGEKKQRCQEGEVLEKTPRVHLLSGVEHEGVSAWAEEGQMKNLP